MTALRSVRVVLWSVVIAVLGAVAASAQPAAGTEPADLARARTTLAAAAAAGDRGAYGALLAEDVTWIDAAGRLRDRQALLATLAPGGTSAAVPPPVRAIVYPGGALVTGRDAADNARFLQVWVKSGTAWQLVAHHGAPEGTQAVPAARTPSSKPPASSGGAAERAAVARNVDAYLAATQKGDADAFGATVADAFFTIISGGLVLDKSGRADQLRVSSPSGSPILTQEVSTRVYGPLAVTVDRSGTRADGTAYPPSRRTIVSVKQGTAWQVAAQAVTRITTP